MHPRSEYRALASLVSEVPWLKSLLQDIRFPIISVPTLWCDNLSAKAIANNLVLHVRTKHVEIDLHFIRDKVLNKEIVIGYVPSFEQPVDIFTKPLSRTRFDALCGKLKVIVAPTCLRGTVK